MSDDKYGAIVCRLENVRKHPNADRILLAEAQNHTVVVGLEQTEGELGLFFRDDLILSDEFCTMNDLYARFDEAGRKVGGGFFDKGKPKVRAQNFRGEKSEGFWCRLDRLGAFAQYVKEGQILAEVTAPYPPGEAPLVLPLCTKHITEATGKAANSANLPGFARKKNKFFPEHKETSQFRYEVDKIPVGSTLYISEKLEGTSARYGYVPDTDLGRLEKWLLRPLRAVYNPLATFWGLPLMSEPYVFLSGSRRVVLKAPSGIREEVGKLLSRKLDRGEVVYGEIVGWNGQKTIMPIQSVPTSGKALRTEYGDKMIYSYGCKPGEWRLFVYRITELDGDSKTHELSDEDMRVRVDEMGLSAVPLLSILQDINQDRKDTLATYVGELVTGPSCVDESHIKEGVVVRVETPDGKTYFLKEKSFEYKVLSGLAKDTEQYVDPEESA